MRHSLPSRFTPIYDMLVHIAVVLMYAAAGVFVGIVSLRLVVLPLSLIIMDRPIRLTLDSIGWAALIGAIAGALVGILRQLREKW